MLDNHLALSWKITSAEALRLKWIIIAIKSLLVGGNFNVNMIPG